MTIGAGQQTESCNRDELRTAVLNALGKFRANESADFTCWNPATRVTSRNVSSESQDAATAAAVAKAIRNITAAAFADADRVAKYLENTVDHLQSIGCTSKRKVEDYFDLARKTLVSLYLAASKPQPSPTELTKLALRFALDARKPIQGNVRRFDLERTEEGWKVMTYPFSAVKVPTIPLPGKTVRDVFAVKILDHLRHDPPQIYGVMDVIETILGCVPTERGGLDEGEEAEGRPAKPEIRVDLKKCIVWLNEEPIVVSTDGAYFVDAVARADGNWVSFTKTAPTQMHRDMVGPRPDRVRKRLPPELRDLFESEGGKGSRLRVT